MSLDLAAVDAAAIDGASVALRALGFIALLQAAGTALFLALLGNRLVLATPAVERLGRASAWLALPLLVAWQLLEGARIAGDLAGVLDPAMQGIALLGSAGIANLLRAAALLLVAVALRPGIAWRTAGLLGGTLLAASFLLTGHTTVGAHRLLLAPLLLLHVWVVAFWLGSLLPLLVVTMREPAVVTGLVVGAFSRLASWLVPCIALAGGLLAWTLLPGWAALRTPYGMLLVAKACGFCVLMALAALNRWRLGPAVSAGEPRAAGRFCAVLVAEFVILCGVLAATATMTGLYSPEP
jgi:putative copper resistance protein D